MSTPSDRKYTDSHEWVKVEGDVATLGITAFAVNELTDITYAEMKTAGTTIGSGDAIGEVESVKATSDIYSPVSGEITEVNEAIDSDPSLVNSEPYEGGWLIKVKLSDPSEAKTLMDAALYDEKYPLD